MDKSDLGTMFAFTATITYMGTCAASNMVNYSVSHERERKLYSAAEVACTVAAPFDSVAGTVRESCVSAVDSAMHKRPWSGDASDNLNSRMFLMLPDGDGNSFFANGMAIIQDRVPGYAAALF